MAESGFRSLEVWKLAMDMTVAVYRATGDFPKHETYGITSQLRRAAASVAANIAEGNGRTHTGDYLRHLSIARGSLVESETFVELSVRLGYLTEGSAKPLLELHTRVGKMLWKLIKSIERRGDYKQRDEPGQP